MHTTMFAMGRATPGGRAIGRALAVLLLVAGGLTSGAISAAVPNPIVTGPIPAGAFPGDPSRNYPWLSTMHNLAAVGYVEEEFFYEGTANRYNTPGPLGTTGSVLSGGHPYKTRMIVRRPISGAKFNGTVIVEWQNVTSGFDLDAHWGVSFDHFIRAGYAWVGVSAQRVGVQAPPNGLTSWNPIRYGQLDVTAAGTITNDALSYDVFAQAMQAIRSPVGVDPMGGLVVERVFAVGASQSATFLTTFINSLHQLIGGPVDAYQLLVGGGRIRDDLNVPVFKQISESDVPGQVASRQPDTAMFRSWEMAGISHSGRRTAFNYRPLVIRDGVALTPGSCAFPVHPRVPVEHIAAAIYDHMVGWVRDHTLPPTAPRITTAGNTIQRDSFGNALGGIRLAEFAVPTATNTGANSGASFCSLYGRYVPFSDETVNALYPTRAAYVEAVNAVTDANQAAGYILPVDAVKSKFLAAQGIVGNQHPCGSACRLAQDLLEASYFYLYTTPGGDDFGNKMIGSIAEIARGSGTGDPAANANARRALQRYVDTVNALRLKGLVSSTSANELINLANGVIASLP